MVDLSLLIPLYTKLSQIFSLLISSITVSEITSAKCIGKIILYDFEEASGILRIKKDHTPTRTGSQFHNSLGRIFLVENLMLL